MTETGAMATDEASRFASWVAPSLLAMTRLAARLAPHADTDGLVQNALLRAWTKWDQFDPARGTASAWLLAITVDQARAARRVRVRWRQVVGSTTDVPDGVAESRRDVEGELDLGHAIRQLPERQRLAVDCYYFIGLGIGETAAVTNCSPGTVKSTLHDARRRLRDLLGDSDEQH